MIADAAGYLLLVALVLGALGAAWASALLAEAWDAGVSARWLASQRLAAGRSRLGAVLARPVSPQEAAEAAARADYVAGRIEADGLERALERIGG